MFRPFVFSSKIGYKALRLVVIWWLCRALIVPSSRPVIAVMGALKADKPGGHVSRKDREAPARLRRQGRSNWNMGSKKIKQQTLKWNSVKMCQVSRPNFCFDLSCNHWKARCWWFRIKSFAVWGGAVHNWHSAVVAKNGAMYAVPFSASFALKVEFADGFQVAVQMAWSAVFCWACEVTRLGSFGNTMGKWSQAILSPHGDVYGVPWSADKVLKIRPESDEAGATWGNRGQWKISGDQWWLVAVIWAIYNPLIYTHIYTRCMMFSRCHAILSYFVDIFKHLSTFKISIFFCIYMLSYICSFDLNFPISMHTASVVAWIIISLCLRHMSCNVGETCDQKVFKAEVQYESLGANTYFP